MADDIALLVNEAWPYMAGALSAYGMAVLGKAQETAADATVGWGRRLLQRILCAGEAPEALADLAEDPEDADLQAALRVQLGKMLRSDESLTEEVRSMLAEASGGGLSALARRANSDLLVQRSASYSCPSSIAMRSSLRCTFPREFFGSSGTYATRSGQWSRVTSALSK